MPNKENNGGPSGSQLKVLLINICAFWVLHAGTNLSLSVDVAIRLDSSSFMLASKVIENRES